MNFSVVALLCMIFRTVPDSHSGHIPHTTVKYMNLKIFQVKNNQLIYIYIFFFLFLFSTASVKVFSGEILNGCGGN